MHTQVRVEARINESLEGVDDAHKQSQAYIAEIKRLRSLLAQATHSDPKKLSTEVPVNVCMYVCM